MTGTLVPDRAARRVDRSDARRPTDPSRRSGRWPRRVLVLLAVAVVAGGAVAAVVFAPATAVDRVDVVVAGGDDPEVVRAVLDAAAVRPGDPWLLVDPGAVRNRIAAEIDPLSVRVRRVWPREVTIDVAPRRTVAVVVVPGRDEVRLGVGPGGRVLGPVTADGPPGAAPTVRVDPRLLPAGPPATGALLDEPVRTAVAAVEQLPPGLRPLLADARLDGGGELEFRLPELAGQAIVRFGGPELLPAKTAAAEAMLVGNVDLRCLEVLDVRRPDRPTIERSCEPGG